MRMFHRCLRSTYPEVLLLVGGSVRNQGLLPPTPNERGVIMASGRPQHILRVEDAEDTSSATTAMLERLGYSVRTETEGLNRVREGKAHFLRAVEETSEEPGERRAERGQKGAQAGPRTRPKQGLG